MGFNRLNVLFFSNFVSKRLSPFRGKLNVFFRPENVSNLCFCIIILANSFDNFFVKIIIQKLEFDTFSKQNRALKSENINLICFRRMTPSQIIKLKMLVLFN